LAGEICQRYLPSRLDSFGGRQIRIDDLELCLEKQSDGKKIRVFGSYMMPIWPFFGRTCGRNV